MAPLDISPRPRTRLMDEAVYRELASLGKRFDQEVLERTTGIFAKLHEKRDDSALTLVKDLSYGPDARHLLDVHTADKSGSAPVVIYFHGGGFVGGTKNVVGDLIYGNVPSFFASHGFVGVNATYRLAPQAKWPEGGRDVGAALAWVRDNIAEYGGDPKRVFLMGQSAGAAHVASYAFRGDIHGSGGPGCNGVMLLSGVYDIRGAEPAPNVVAYFGDDPSAYADKSTVGHITVGSLPVFMTVTEFDPFMFERNLVLLANDLVTNFGNMPRFKQLLGHNHISQALSLGTDDPTLGPDLLDFVSSHS